MAKIQTYIEKSNYLRKKCLKCVEIYCFFIDFHAFQALFRFLYLCPKYTAKTKSKIAQKYKVKWRKNEKFLGYFIFFAYICTQKVIDYEIFRKNNR